mmetsp:Transcript_3702/g.8447  ORF Transcript_3702/g.8447 Transcript_3702/m.8447 type:complete len:297 (+) Transcript_3702:326-1216(+)
MSMTWVCRHRTHPHRQTDRHIRSPSRRAFPDSVDVCWHHDAAAHQPLDGPPQRRLRHTALGRRLCRLWPLLSVGCGHSLPLDQPIRPETHNGAADGRRLDWLDAGRRGSRIHFGHHTHHRPHSDLFVVRFRGGEAGHVSNGLFGVHERLDLDALVRHQHRQKRVVNLEDLCDVFERSIPFEHRRRPISQRTHVLLGTFLICVAEGLRLVVHDAPLHEIPPDGLALPAAHAARRRAAIAVVMGILLQHQPTRHNDSSKADDERLMMRPTRGQQMRQKVGLEWHCATEGLRATRNNRM